MGTLFTTLFYLLLFVSGYFLFRIIISMAFKQPMNTYKKKLGISLILLAVSLIGNFVVPNSQVHLSAKREKFQIETPKDDEKLYEQKMLEEKNTKEITIKHIQEDEHKEDELLPSAPKELTPEEKVAKEFAEEKRIAEQQAAEERKAQEEARRQAERQAAEERRREQALAKTLRVTPYEFVQKFNDSAYDLGVGDTFSIGEPQIQNGNVQDTTRYIFNDNLAILEVISKENGNIKELTVLVSPNKNVDQFRVDLMSAVVIYSAAIKATNPNLTFDDVSVIQEKLGMNMPITEWVNNSSTVYDGRKYVKQLVKGVGFSFIITTP